MDRTPFKFAQSPLDALAHNTITTFRRIFPLPSTSNPSLNTKMIIRTQSFTTTSTSTSICSLSPTSSCNKKAMIESPCMSWAMVLLNFLLPAAAYAKSPPESPLESIMASLKQFNDKTTPEIPEEKKTFYKPADRIIAIGDVHGDVDAMRTALRNANIINEKDKWVGGKSVLVQVGDQLDRGNTEREIYKLLFQLQDSAPSSGGAVHILLGNHELMNARLDFRYVSNGGFAEFNDRKNIENLTNQKVQNIPRNDLKMIKTLPKSMQQRAKAIVAGGSLATELSKRTKLTVVVGDTLFVHAGLSPNHFQIMDKSDNKCSEAARTLEDMNKETKDFLNGKADFPTILHGGNSPVWMRDYSRPGIQRGGRECKMLDETLNMIGVKRMVVGHTPQAEGINAACGGKVWRIDTGMSKAYGGVPEAIEISKRGSIKVLTTTGMVQGSARVN